MSSEVSPRRAPRPCRCRTPPFRSASPIPSRRRAPSSRPRSPRSRRRRTSRGASRACIDDSVEKARSLLAQNPALAGAAVIAGAAAVGAIVWGLVRVYTR